jgi:hypothetical protein
LTTFFTFLPMTAFTYIGHAAITNMSFPAPLVNLEISCSFAC